MKIVLASGSPRRAELLRQIGLDFEVDATHGTDETVRSGEDPAAAAERLARDKAAACRAARPDADVVVAADTIVVLDGAILGKPADLREAAAMLAALSGRSHDVVTGFAVQARERILAGSEITHVRFRSLSDAEVTAYVATGDPLDKAGAYGIQGRAAVFVEGIAGDYFTVVGLPLARVATALRAVGVAVLGDRA
ncbi:MAG: septum formation inhibitor Maf [Candidatus Sericytochromatia bacterium]|uniref:dTTP/UTP pyrophosphatase n=1 Tax=Candidatus Tanganyikabacteria bacterium TaxID=2961651 RepID=A0A937X5T0_9BACT|nr:septum formation inhibitor Maf [Candidatus Tanganyikabacteria bacterium]